MLITTLTVVQRFWCSVQNTGLVFTGNCGMNDYMSWAEWEQWLYFLNVTNEALLHLLCHCYPLLSMRTSMLGRLVSSSRFFSSLIIQTSTGFHNVISDDDVYGIASHTECIILATLCLFNKKFHFDIDHQENTLHAQYATRFSNDITFRLVYFSHFHSLMSYSILLRGNAADVKKRLYWMKRG